MDDQYGNLGKNVATLPVGVAPTEVEGYGKLDKVRYTCVVHMRIST